MRPLARLALGLTLLSAAPASAAEFYLLNIGDPQSKFDANVTLIEPDAIYMPPGGTRITEVMIASLIDLGPDQFGGTLDLTSTEFDCSQPRYRVLGEVLYLELRSDAERDNKGSLNSKDWQAIRPGGAIAADRALVCAWHGPNTRIDPNLALRTEAPDMFEAARKAVATLHRMAHSQ